MSDDYPGVTAVLFSILLYLCPIVNDIDLCTEKKYSSTSLSRNNVSAAQ